MFEAVKIRGKPCWCWLYWKFRITNFMNHGICKRAANRENLLGCSSFTYVFSFCVFSVILFGYVNFSIFQEAAHLMSAPAKLEFFCQVRKKMQA